MGKRQRFEAVGQIYLFHCYANLNCKVEETRCKKDIISET